jgi:hypothetical protein
MSLFIVVFMALVIVVQLGNLVCWFLRQLGFDMQDKQSTEAIVKELGYTMEQYNTSERIRALTISEWCNRIRNS